MLTNPPSPHSSNTSGSDSPSPSPTINQVPAVLALQQKKKHICHYPNCTRAFTTSGHLARHARVHTGERKHKCPFPGCETRCSRQDNLQQHYRIHLSPGSRRAPTRNAARQSRTSTPTAEPAYAPPQPPPPSQQQQQQHVTQSTVVPPPPDSPPALVMATVEAYQRRHSYQSAPYPDRGGYYATNEPARPDIPSRQNSYDAYSAPHRDSHYPSRPPLPSPLPASYPAPETNTRSTSYGGAYPSTSYTRDTYVPPKSYAPASKANYDQDTAHNPSYGSGPASRLVDPPKEYESYAGSDREAYNGHGGVEPYHSNSYQRPMQYVNA